METPIKDLPQIREELKAMLLGFQGPLRVRVDKESNFEVAGTIPAMQGKSKVDGIYFSSIVPRAKAVHFYFFPAYTHPQAFENLSEALKKCKKGKSCFHVKYLDAALMEEIRGMVAQGVAAYQKDGLLAN